MMRQHDVTSIVNPRRACAARVTVLGLCVCVCVCVTQHLTFGVTIHATNHTNHLLPKEGQRFSLEILPSRVMASFTYHGQRPRRYSADSGFSDYLKA